MFATIKALVCAVLYGILENRFMFEGSGDKHTYWIFNHFKTYHLLMLFLFATISFTTNWLLYLWNLIAMPFIQDLTWQTIERRKLKQDDWSNFGKFPLIHGWYVWYWLSLLALTLLGVVNVYLWLRC